MRDVHRCTVQSWDSIGSQRSTVAMPRWVAVLSGSFATTVGGVVVRSSQRSSPALLR